MSSHPLTIVIVTYNSAHCIASLSQGIGSLPHIIVVDNASSDDTLAQCATLLPHALCIASPKNLGFGAANNLALAQVHTPYALLLNPDCEITTDAIDALVAQAAAFPDAAMLTPQIIGHHNKREINYGWVKHAWKSKGEAEGLCCVGYATGAVMLLNMSVTRPLGFFDERFFLYYEDDDICLKYFNAKHAIIFTPHITVFHASRGSVRTKNVMRQEFWRGYHHAQSKLLITEKYEGTPKAQRLRRKKITTACFAVLGCALIFNFKIAARMLGRVKGMLDYSSAHLNIKNQPN